MNSMVLRDFLKQAMVASIYVVLVYVLQFASFGLIQFRVAEVLMIFILFDKRYIIGLTIGCFVANLVGGAILIDVIFGSLATTIAGALMYVTKSKPLLSMIWPAVINGLIIGVILTYAYVSGPLYLTIPAVFIGEFVVMYALGYPLYVIIKKHPSFMEFFDR